MVTQL
jgi:hypothetical protein